MEETSGAVAKSPFGETPLVESPLVESPFGESPFGELVNHWLDEGDRLSASAAAAPAPAPAAQSRLRHLLQSLRPVIGRHRLFVLAGIGLLPVVLFLCTRRGARVQAPAPTVAAALPVTASPGLQSSLLSKAPARAAPAPATVAVASAASAEAKPALHRHHRHHRHHAAGAPSKIVASVGRATRR